MDQKKTKLPFDDESIEYIVNNLHGKGTVLLDKKDAKEKDIVIGYHQETQIYVAWNNCTHRLAKGVIRGNTHTYTLPRRTRFIYKICDCFEEIYPVYKPLQGSRKKEKIVLIKPSFIDEFCKHPFAYLMPNEEDSTYENGTIYALPGMDTIKVYEKNTHPNYFLERERQRFNCTKAERDAKFRSSVFGKYSSPHCIICGIDNEKVLQAAHIVAVKDGGDDSPENGMILCANHHLMYDSDEFNIDHITGQIKIKNTKNKKYLEWDLNKGYVLK